MDPLSLTAGKLIFTGAMLSIGWWMGKKLTNQIDSFIDFHSNEYLQIGRDKKKDKKGELALL